MSLEKDILKKKLLKVEDHQKFEVFSQKLYAGRELKAGKAIFPVLETNELTTWIASTLKPINEMLPETLLKIVRQSIYRASEKKDLLREIQAGISTYNSHPEHKFLLLTSISVDRAFFPLKKKKVGNASISFVFQPKLMNKIKGFSEGDGRRFELTENYLPIVVTIYAKSELEAGFNALDALDFLRSIWNFSINKKIYRRYTTPAKPLNEILLGDKHLIFNCTKDAFEEMWLYEKDFHKSLAYSNKLLSKEFVYEKKVGRALNRSKIFDHLKIVFLAYVRAFDSSDSDVVFLKLWVALEHLFGTDQSKILRKRLLFLMPDYEYNQCVFDILRNQRNVMTHAFNSHSPEIDAMVFQLKYYFDSVLPFFIFNPLKLDSIQEFFDVLDSPHSSDAIEGKLKILNKAHQFTK